jgi:hypothetical protein
MTMPELISTTAAATPGVRGHTRSTWRDEAHLRGLLLRLITRHPDATRDQLEALYLDKAKRTDALVDEALRRAFDNDLAQMQKSPRAAHQRVAAADVAAASERLASVVLLDLVQPNGKKLRDCTGKECRQVGGWLIKVADRIGNRGVVGRKLSEAEVASIFASGARE